MPLRAVSTRDRLSAVLCDDDQLTVAEGVLAGASAASAPEPVGGVLLEHPTLNEVKKRYVVRTWSIA
jgi:hypothetical protein